MKCSGRLLPALFTRTSNREIFLRIFLNSSAFVTSQTKALLEPLVFLIIFPTLIKSDFVLLNMITFAPASAKAIEHAFPMPFPAPVTKAI